ncbi:hypothetical protein [Catellatospora tritici]|uniref:hypothetical protein n=1 Tax=Catellatospora tritici TaxID=2851566 RepID=UPI001C2D8E10|nr:hypothetical protein [Catellatospora tritici]MBV1855881.1 hypothetical protein [Catellatospora tritici]
MVALLADLISCAVITSLTLNRYTHHSGDQGQRVRAALADFSLAMGLDTVPKDEESPSEEGLDLL